MHTPCARITFEKCTHLEFVVAFDEIHCFSFFNERFKGFCDASIPGKDVSFISVIELKKVPQYEDNVCIAAYIIYEFLNKRYFLGVIFIDVGVGEKDRFHFLSR